MKNQKSLQQPQECCQSSAAVESAIEDAMQQWLDRAQNSSDVRDRIAVAGGISRGVFGSLHLGAMEYPEFEPDDAASNDGDYNELKRAA